MRALAGASASPHPRSPLQVVQLQSEAALAARMGQEVAEQAGKEVAAARVSEGASLQCTSP